MASTNSAIYVQLYAYSNISMHMDQLLDDEAKNLRVRLDRFSSKCTESKFRVDVSGIDRALQSYTNDSRVVDGRIYNIGYGFEVADRGTAPWRPYYQTWDTTLVDRFGEALPWAEGFLTVVVSGILIIGSKGGRYVKPDVPKLFENIGATKLLRDFVGLKLKTNRIYLDNYVKGYKSTIISNSHPFGIMFLITASVDVWLQFREDEIRFAFDPYRKWAAHLWDSAVVFLFAAGAIVFTKMALIVLAALAVKIIALLGIGATIAAAIASAPGWLVVVIAALAIAAIVAVGIFVGWATKKLADYVIESELSTEVIDNLAEVFRWAHDGLKDHHRRFIEFMKSGNEPPPALIYV